MWKWTQRSFAGGQQDHTLAGRQDLASYFTSAKTLENFLVKRQGCISKRRGTELIAELTTGFPSNEPVIASRVIPFVYERDGGYMLLFSCSKNYRRVFVLSHKGILIAHQHYANKGDSKAVKTTYSWEKKGANTEGYQTVMEDGVEKTYYVKNLPRRFEHPYEANELNDFGYCQTGDVLFLTHRNHPVHTIKKTTKGTTFEDCKAIDFLTLGASTQYYPPLLRAELGKNESTGSYRSVSYVATYVKDGIESAPSTPVYVSYQMPWSNEFSVKVTASKGTNATEPDFYNVYKKVSGEYGFIGSTGASLQVVQPVLSSQTGNFGLYDLNTSPTEEGGQTTIKAWKTDTTFKNAFFSKGTLFSYFYGQEQPSHYHGGIMGSSGVKLNFAKGVAFSDVTFAVGMANFKRVLRSGNLNYGGLWYETYFYFKTVKGDKMTCKITVSNGTKKSTYTATHTLAEKADFSNWVDFYDVETGEYYSNMTQAEFDALTQPTTVTMSFRGDIEKDFPDGGWYVVSLEIHCTKYNSSTAKDVEVETLLSYVECMYSDKFSNSVSDDYITPDVSLTPPMVDPHFDDVGKYPATVAIQDQRLALAATSNQPFTFWLSCAGDLYNFNTHATIRDDDAIEATIPATEFPEINHIVAAKEMMLFCDNGEWTVAPVSGNTLAYSTIEIKQQSQIGCSKRLPPLHVADEIVFSESTNETLRSIKYDFTSDGYQSVDLSVLSQSLTRNNPIVDYAYKQHPDSIIVCVRKDGTLATLTYMKEHELCAWSTTVLGGGLKAVGIATDKAIRDGTTDLYILATREGEEGFKLLRVREDSPTDTVERSVCLDAMTVVDAAAATDTIPDGKVAVDLLTGETVDALVDGRRYAVGYPYAATFRSITPEAQGESTIQFEIKGAKSIELRLENASKFKVVPTVLENESVNYWTTCGDDVIVQDGQVTFNVSDHVVDLAGDANTSGAVTIQSDSVWPLTVLSYSINFEFDPRFLGQKG